MTSSTQQDSWASHWSSVTCQASTGLGAQGSASRGEAVSKADTCQPGEEHPPSQTPRESRPEKAGERITRQTMALNRKGGHKGRTEPGVDPSLPGASVSHSPHKQRAGAPPVGSEPPRATVAGRRGPRKGCKPANTGSGRHPRSQQQQGRGRRRDPRRETSVPSGLARGASRRPS